MRVYGQIISWKKLMDASLGFTKQEYPYCGVTWIKFPKAKSKGKACGKYMYIRTRPYDDKKNYFWEHKGKTKKLRKINFVSDNDTFR